MQEGSKWRGLFLVLRSQMALNSTSGIGINGETKLDDGLRRFASCEQSSQLVNATFDGVFFRED
jgi:hypothetical protein